MSFDAGSVFVRLVGLFDQAEFDKWDKAVDSERAKSEKGIEIKLAADTAGLDKDLTEARGKVSRWARTQDKFTLGYSRGDLDRELTDAKGRISAWGDKTSTFKLGYGKGQLDESLKGARSQINTWGDFENKFNLGYNKGHLSEQLIEARRQIRTGLAGVGDIKVDVDTTQALAKLTALRAEAAALGGVSGGAAGGGGGGGSGAAGAAAAAAGGGGFERGLQSAIFRPGGPRIPGTRLRIGLGGLSLSTILGLGPEHVVGAGLAVGGSAVGAGAGAGALGLGALGQFAVGGGSDLAVVKSTITDTQQIAKAMDAVTAAEQRYGKGSNQAKIATAQLNTTMADLGNTAGVKAEAGLAKAAKTLNEQWDKATSQARVNAVAIMTQVLDVGHTFVPLIANAAAQNLSIINTSLKPLFSWLKGPEGVQIFHDLEYDFKTNLPVAMDAFKNGIELVLRLMQLAAQYTGGFTQALDAHLKKWNDLNNAYLNSNIAKVVNDFRIWEGLVLALSHDLHLLFKAGAGEGNDLVVMLTNVLKRWGDWEASAKGQDFLHTFFENRKVELEAVLQLVGAVLKMFGEFYMALQPLVPAITLFAKAAADGMGQLAKLLQPVFTLLSNILTAFVHLGQKSTLFKDAVIVPLGLAILSFRLFGSTGTKAILDISGHLTTMRNLMAGARAAMGALFAGEGVGAAWQKLKDAMKPTAADSPAATMEAGIVTGSKEGSAIMSEAIIAAMKEGSAFMGFGAGPGGALTAEERAAANAVAEERGLPAPATTRFVAGPGGVVTDLEAAGGGAAGAGGLRGVLGRFGGRAAGLGRGLAGGLGRAVPGLLATGIGAQLYSSAQQRHSLSGMVLGGAVAAGGAAGAVGAAAGGLPAVPAALVGGLAGGVAGAASYFLGPVLGFGSSGPSKQEKDLQAFTDKVKAIKDPARLSAEQIKNLQAQATHLAQEVPKAEGPLNALWHRLNSLPAAVNLRNWNNAFNMAWKAVHNFAIQGGDSIVHLKDRFDTNMRLIAHEIGLNTDEGRKLAGANINKMVDELEHAMVTGKVKVGAGMKLIRQVLDQGMKDNEVDWNTSWTDMVNTLTTLYHKHKINAQTYWRDLRTIYSEGQTKIKDDSNAQLKWNEAWLKKQHDDGVLTQQQLNNDLHALRVKANATAKTDMQGFAGTIASGYAAATGGANQSLQALWKTTNSMLKVLHAPALSPLQIAAATGRVDVQGSAFLTHGAGTRAGSIPGNAQGGPAPGSEFGYSDNMTLVDPRGVPRAKMAGDEWIFTRHQAPFVDMGLRAIGFGGGADELWSTVNRPHGYERGGKLRGFAQGGSAFPDFPANFDGKPGNVVGAVREIIGLMEHRFPNLIVTATRNGTHANGSFHYIGEAVDMAADPGTMTNAANYVMMSGLYKYLLEGIHNPNLSIKNGKRVSPGFWGSATWAQHLNHLHLAADGTLGGLSNTGSGAVGGIGAWNDIATPRVKGTGPIRNIVQSVLAAATKAANNLGNKEAGVFDFSGITGGGSNIQNQNLGHRMMRAAGWGDDQWPSLQALWTQESGWSSTAVNPSSGAYGIPQSLGHGHPYNLGDAKAQIAWGLQYIKQRYGSPEAAESHEKQYNWYNLGGRLHLPGFRRGGRVSHARRTLVIPHPKIAHVARKRATKKAAPPKKTKTHRPKSLASFVGTVPGTKAFSADDAKISTLEDQYNRQEQIFELYDSTATTTGNLPVNDLDVLSGIRMDEWNILDDEYTKLPGILEHLHQSLQGAPSPRHPTAKQKRQRAAQQRRHKQAVHRESGQYGGAQVVVPEPGEGINKLVAEYETAINKDEVMVAHLQGDIRKATEQNRLRNIKASQKALSVAEGIAKQQAGAQDKIIGNLTAASLITDQIESLPVPQTATELGGLSGTAYAQGQAHNSGLAKTNARIRAQRQQLYKKRNDILKGNITARAELEKLQRQKTNADNTLRGENFAAAWAYAIKKYGLQARVFKIQELLKVLKAKLTKEKKLQKEYQDAYDTLETRLFGGDAQDPSATDIQQQMGDIGFDILSLIQEGADNVPSQMVTNIRDLLTKLGIALPPGAGTPGGAASTTAGAAFDDFLAFQQSRSDLFAQFGSNFVAVGANPLAGAAGIAAGSQFYGAAAGPAGGGAPAPGGVPAGPAGPPPIPGAAGGGALVGQGGTNITITQHFGGPPPDAHTYAAGLEHEMNALM